MPTPAHFIFIPGVLLIGIVVGWILGSRAAADAYAARMRSAAARKPPVAGPPTQARPPDTPPRDA